MILRATPLFRFAPKPKEKRNPEIVRKNRKFIGFCLDYSLNIPQAKRWEEN
jgi:hypothetical protein